MRQRQFVQIRRQLAAQDVGELALCRWARPQVSQPSLALMLHTADQILKPAGAVHEDYQDWYSHDLHFPDRQSHLSMAV